MSVAEQPGNLSRGQPDGGGATLAQLFPGNMGRVELTRVAVRLRLPALMRMSATETIDPQLAARLRRALLEVRRG